MTEQFDELRPKAFAIAYRMLGSVSEAEDVVQEALLRLHRTSEQGEPIESPRAYLATVVTRLAIDELRSDIYRHMNARFGTVDLAFVDVQRQLAELRDRGAAR